MIPKCMVCGDSSHGKDNCPVKEVTQFKCANCGGNHKSNFWDCPIRKKVLDSRAKHQQKSKPKIFQTQTSLPTSACLLSRSSSEANTNGRGNGNISTRIEPNISFASVVSGASKNFKSSNVLPALQQAPIPTNGKFSANNASGCDDLGDVTLENMTFLQNSLFDLIQTMSKATSMIEAIQIGLKFANDIVLALKFNHGSK